MHEARTPEDDGEHQGDDPENNEPQGQCRNSSDQSDEWPSVEDYIKRYNPAIGTMAMPLFSINPIILNVVASDIPMWYRTGIGPDIALKLVYNGNNKQEITGGLATPTQYFPMGKQWSFAYAAFYHEATSDSIIVIMGDGQRKHYKWNGSSFDSKYGYEHDELIRYSVTGGYGYTLK